MDEASHLDRLLKAVFQADAEEGESVLQAIERTTGARPRVLLREGQEAEPPVLRPPGEDRGPRLCEDRRYQFLGEIARGGIGVVQKGHDRNLGRSVALKVLRTEHLADEETRRRFIEEAQIGGQLQHPGIVPVYGMGLDAEGCPYFAMQLVKGETLAAHLEDRATPTDERARLLGVFEHVAQTVAYAHARGVIHRDLKPSNVMIGKFGEVQVLDWGLAKVLGHGPFEAPRDTIISTVRTETEGSASLVGSVMGTPAYMPPEQAMGRVEDLDERSDAFALGAVLTEILTGQPPYTGDSKDRLVMAAQARLDDAYARLDASGADDELIALAKNCLQPNPDDRPRSAGVVARWISRYLGEADERARQAETDAARDLARAAEEQERKAHERHRLETAEAARRQTRSWTTVAALIVLAGVVGWLMKENADRARAEGAERVVAACLLDATGHLGAGAWEEAMAATTNAVALAEARGADAAVHQRAVDLLARVEEERAAAEAAARVAVEDDELLATLRALDLRRAPDVDPEDVDRRYAAAFRALEADVDALAPVQAAAWLLTRTKPRELAREFDAWARLRRFELEVPSSRWAHLLEVARSVDPDPWRDRLRDSAVAGDVDALWRMAEEAQGKELPAPTSDLLGSLLVAHDAEEATDFLRQAVLEHPDDLHLNLHLAARLREGEPDEQRDAKRFEMAGAVLQAVAARTVPTNEGE